MKRILLYSLVLVFANNLVAQTQIGADINGSADNVLGFTVSLSSNGSRMAAGAPYSTGTSTNGYAHVHEKVSSAWVLKGTAIGGEAMSDNFGRVAISGDGNRLAVGASTNDGNGANSGHVRVYNFNGTNWAQMGTDINGEAANDNSGVKVSLSNDGSVVAIGAHLNDGNGADSGHVRVYAWNGSAWVQRGADLNGEAAGDEFGVSVSISLDGTKLAVGGRKNDGSGVDAGHVRVFAWNGSSWVQTGADINGEAAGDFFGSAVSISNNGLRVAVGAPLADGTSLTNCGHVRIYNFNGTSWGLLGADIDGIQNSSGFGSSVSMNGAGDAIVSGAPTYDTSASNTDRGQARYFRWNGTAWTQVGSSISGNGQNGEQLGYSVAMSNDGNTVSVGVPFNPARGYVRVYDFTSALSSSDFQLNNKFSVYPNPINNQFQLNADISIDKVEVLNLQGQVIKTFESQEFYNINELSAGIYLVMIHSEEGKGIKKIIKN
ncbi:T9SS type A sorting domain-containing protein [Flavobacterium sp.]|uniref:T9SS type A sorting domain-containing protein n=1 Tax=Flavobacterium sp. TaxID=239 RepID=UPI0008B01945|nr:T9SS type A sorting domain-containing protein [Flavobacterium sp.]OGS62657.1 MAG: hypothetical protein A2X07_10775 [Flavobacteria bacterium GWF1_32_7]HBD25266.1 hypothetical protein [Flavobacterium sp.]